MVDTKSTILIGQKKAALISHEDAQEDKAAQLQLGGESLGPIG